MLNFLTWCCYCVAVYYFLMACIELVLGFWPQLIRSLGICMLFSALVALLSL
jgi:hypothetical protein